MSEIQNDFVTDFTKLLLAKIKQFSARKWLFLNFKNFGLTCSKIKLLSTKHISTELEVTICQLIKYKKLSLRRPTFLLKCRVWHSHGHVITMPVAIPNKKISAV